jgi:3-oxoacyl-[acyl-carrier protein] reductase
MDSVTLTPWPGITGRVTLVSGASRGIGRAIAEALAGQGATVIGTATTQLGANGISAYLQELNANGRGIILDVSEQDSIDALFEDISNAEGLPEILINNAGVTRDNLLVRMSPEEWDLVLSTNLSSIYRLSKASLRSMMKGRWGRIINITSIVGLTGNPGQTNYAAAKAGMIGFTKSLAAEVASRNITVNAIAPGFIDTDMTRELDESQTDALRQQIPAGRLGTAGDIAAGVVFLASDAGAYITGETLNINGGLSMV